MQVIRTAFSDFLRPLMTVRAHWRHKQHPLFRAEIARPTPHLIAQDVLRNLRLGRPPSPVRRVLWALLAFTVIVLWPVVAFIQILAIALVSTLVLLPFVPWVWRVPIAMDAAVPLARERESRRWAVLRTTPYSTEDILLALQAAGTYRIRRLWSYITRARLIAAGGFLLAMLASTLNDLGHSDRAIHLIPSALPDWIAYLTCALYFVIEPLLDVGVDGALGVLASTFIRSPLGAMLGGFLLRAGLWLLQSFSVILLLPVTWPVLAPAQAELLPVLVFLGPAYGPLLDIPSPATMLMVIGMAVLRVAAMHGVIRLTAWRVETVDL